MDIRIEKPDRGFIIKLLLFLSIPFFFVSYILIRDKYGEFFIYGEKTFAILENIETKSTSTGSRGYPRSITESEYTLRVPSENNLFFYSQETGDTRRIINRNVNIGDILEIKILSKSKAKILSYKDIEFNEYNSFWGNFWIFLLIAFLLFIAITPYFLIIFKPRKK